MNSEQAENAVTLSALVTTGMFAYRRAVEPGIAPVRALREAGHGGKRAQNIAADYKSVFGAAPPIEWGQFLKAAGVLFIGLSIVTAASPEIGGSAAVLIGTTAVLGNGIAVMRDLKTEPPTAADVAQTARDTQTIETNIKQTGFGGTLQPYKPGQPLSTLGG